MSITETGSELLIQGAGAAFSTANCLDPMPGLKRSSHSASKRGWSSTCVSPAGDPRRATIQTRISATDDTIVFSETGVYEFAIKDTVCKASVSRSRSFKLSERAGVKALPSASAVVEPSAPPPAPSAQPTAKPDEPTPAPASECDPDATPARFELRPSRKLLRPGDSFAFRTSSFDAKGCSLGSAVELTLEGPAELLAKVKMKGSTLEVDRDAPDGTVTIVATLAGETVKATAEITPIGSYDALLRARGLDARGEDDRPQTAVVAGGVGSKTQTASSQDRPNRIALIASAVGVAFVLAFIALVLLRRGKRQSAPADEESAPPPAVEFFEVPAASEPVLAAEAPVVAPVPVVPGMVCPNCGELYPKGTAFCGGDGTELMPVNG